MIAEARRVDHSSDPARRATQEHVAADRAVGCAVDAVGRCAGKSFERVAASDRRGRGLDCCGYGFAEVDAEDVLERQARDADRDRGEHEQPRQALVGLDDFASMLVTSPRMIRTQWRWK
jgi:hypothetical protein